MSKIIDRMEQNEEIYKKIMDDNKFREIVKDILMHSVYKRLRK
ncbi:MAG: hypothetical protein ABRQ39_09575 [Candidatus Eremiobacterota bacterium]